jgi:hypothetical protein
MFSGYFLFKKGISSTGNNPCIIKNMYYRFTKKKLPHTCKSGLKKNIPKNGSLLLNASNDLFHFISGKKIFLVIFSFLFEHLFFSPFKILVKDEGFKIIKQSFFHERIYYFQVIKISI